MSASKSSNLAGSPRRILGNISNQSGQPSNLAHGRNNRLHGIPIKASRVSWGLHPSASLLWGRQRYFVQHGDLSQLRPVTPPLYSPEQHPILSPGKYVDDVPSKFYTEDSPVDNQAVAQASEHWMENHCDTGVQAPPSTLIPQNVSKHGYAAKPLPAVPTAQDANVPAPENEVSRREKDFLPYKHENVGTAERGAGCIIPTLPLHHNRPIHIQNLGQNWGSFCDVFIPSIRPYPPTSLHQPMDARGLNYIHEAPPVDYLSVCTMWKGLTLDDAKQLLRINQAFRATINYLLASQLEDLSGQSTSAAQDSSPTTAMTIHRRYYLSFNQVVDIIKYSLGSHKLDENTTFRFCDLLYLYLSKVDCLMIDEASRVYRDALVDLVIKYQNPNDAPSAPPLVDAAWLPDYLAFPKTDYLQREGDQLIVIPQYRSSVDLGFESEIAYSLGKQIPWLQWDQSISGWKGLIPHYSHMRTIEDEKHGQVYRTGRIGPDAISNLLRIQVVAHRRETLRSGICVERTLRARLSIKIKPHWTGGVEAVSACHIKYPTESTSSACATACTEGLSTACVSPSSNHWPSHLRQFIEDPMAKAADIESPPTVHYQEQKNTPRQAQVYKGCTVRDIMAQCGLFGKAKPNMVHDNDIQANPVTMTPAGHHNSHMFASSYISAGRSRFSRANGRQRRGLSISSPVQRYYGFLADIQASFNATRRIPNGSDREDPVSPTVARRPSDSIDAQQRLPQRQISLQSHTRTASEYKSAGRDVVVQPAGAEVFAIAQGLHDQPKAQKRVSRSSFEQAPTKRDYEVSGFSGYASDTTTQSLLSKRRSEEGSESPPTPNSPMPLPTSNRYAALASLRNSEDMESSDVGRGSDIPDTDPHVRREREIMSAALGESSLSRQERRDLYEALKMSMEDAERTRYRRFRLRSSDTFVESQHSRGDSSGSGSSAGADLQDVLATVASPNSEGTETSQAMSARPTSPPLRNDPHRVSNIPFGRDADADIDSLSDESSDFEENPAPAIIDPWPSRESQDHKADAKVQEHSSKEQDTRPGPWVSFSEAITDRWPSRQRQDEKADAKVQEDSSKEQETRPAPLMGFFGAGPIARRRDAAWRARAQIGSIGLAKRGGQPKCFGCEVRDTEKE